MGRVVTIGPPAGLSAGSITSGVMSPARLGSGTASSSTFLRGDQQYARLPTTVNLFASDPNGADLVAGNGKAFFTVPAVFSGQAIQSVQAAVTTASTSGLPTVQLTRIRGGGSISVLSTLVTIDANELTSYTAVTASVVNSSNAALQTGDLLRVDVTVAGTGTKGLQVIVSVA